jgi:hypothetical protein
MLAIITSYFNPNRCKYRLKNYKKFKEHIDKAGVDLFTIELATGNNEFELKSKNVKRVRGNSLMFQKERMLNVLIEELPEKYDSVCWIDCDIIYLQNDWPDRIEESLKQHLVTQPYQYAVSLPESNLSLINEATIVCFNCFGSSLIRRSFSSYRNKTNLRNFHDGHVGYVWAARRDFLQKHKLYDPIITGCGDLFMAMAFFGFPDWIEKFEIIGDKTESNFFEWAFAVSEDVKDNVGYTDDLIMHLWHGDLEKRNYLSSSQCLKSCDFDPNLDLRIAENGCWEWNSDNSALHQKIQQIFNLQHNG